MKDEDKDRIIALSEKVVVLLVEEETCLHIESHDIEYVVDSAASYHATSKKEFFISYQVGYFGTVKMGNSSFSKIVREGGCAHKTNAGCILTLKDVHHVLDLCLDIWVGFRSIRF